MKIENKKIKKGKQNERKEKQNERKEKQNERKGTEREGKRLRCTYFTKRSVQKGPKHMNGPR